MIIEKKGNIFTTKAQTIVNTVNCVGIMGAGIAYEFRLREPKMFEKYVDLCEKNMIEIGKLWIYKRDDNAGSYENILNFPTKQHWRYPSKEEYLHKGLQKFVQTYKDRGITSIAFPMLGADKGGIHPKKSLSIMKSYLSKCDIDVEIWAFDPSAEDNLYLSFVEKFTALDEQTIKAESGLRKDLIAKIKEAIDREDINSLSGLLRIKGVGDKTLQKLFDYIINTPKRQKTLFD